MVDVKALVPQLQKQVELLTEDLIEQATVLEAIATFLRAEYRKTIDAGRLSQSYEEWSEDVLEQVAVSWVLSCVFVRFLEDNKLIDECWIAGEGDRGKLADGHHEIYFRSYPHDSDREYLKYVFKEVGKIPAARELFEEDKTPLWAVDPSGDGARRLLLFFKEIDAERGGLKRQFDSREICTGPLVDVYEKLAPQAQFLGDLYQDLSEHARKKYALLQTPEFVQQFILDRTLTPAIEEFGLKGLRIIDPACGSGHFLLGSFDRLFALWMRSDEIRANPVIAVQNAFDSIFGVDINPFAIAITRFRLLIAAVKACKIDRLHQQSYAWKLNLAVGDSLLRGSRPTFGLERRRILYQQEMEFEPESKLPTEDPRAANEILDQSYHVVVGNPPYIIVRDRAQNIAYRQVYSSCHGKYSLGVPFTERFWDLAIRNGELANVHTKEAGRSAGYIGMITANSFMKREFGKRLIEEFFARIELTHVINTEGAFIPGHGTPTVILFGRQQRATGNPIRAVMGIKGEPSTPSDPALGLVWQSILRNIKDRDLQDEFTSSADVNREIFNVHPWSIGGGGAAELRDQLEQGLPTLKEKVESIGFMSITGEDDAFVCPLHLVRKNRLPFRDFCTGDVVRDWRIDNDLIVIFPYNQSVNSVTPIPQENLGCIARIFWPVRTVLANRSMFEKTPKEHGFFWYEYMQLIRERVSSKLLIAFAEVASHNHFVLERGSKIFKQTAPTIRLADSAGEGEYLALVGLLNSSTACFWMKQVSHQKQMMGGDGVRISSRAKVPYQFAGTRLLEMPIPESFHNGPLRDRIELLATRVDLISQQQGSLTAEKAIEQGITGGHPRILSLFQNFEAELANIRSELIFLQEEIDFTCYAIFGLADESLLCEVWSWPSIRMTVGTRPFEILQQSNLDDLPVSKEIPSNWPEQLQFMWKKRLEAIQQSRCLKLLEDDHYKRRWLGRQGLFNHTARQDELKSACENWLLDRLEEPRYWSSLKLQSTARLADRASTDTDFLEVAALYRGRTDFDVAALVAELVEAESVPFLPVLRYKPTGLRKRAVWERTWDLQRREDAGEDVGDIPIPPKYTSADFLKTDSWRLRGKLDVPKERWVSYPHCQTDGDPSLVVGWAGWDHLQQVEALVGYYDLRKREGWDARRLTPFLAGLNQLLPWVYQWHPQIVEEFGESAGRSYQTLLEQDAHELGLTLENVRNWTPPETARKTRAARKKKTQAEDDE